MITSKCSKKCNIKIKKEFQLEEKKDIDFSTPIIQLVDGKYGQAFISNDCGGDHTINVHNDMIFGSIDLELLPGEHAFHLHIDNCNIRDSYNHPITLKLEAGHKYSFVQISKTKGNTYDRSYRVIWSPVILDITDNKIIYPSESIKWYNASETERW